MVVDAVERHDKALVKLVHGVDSLNERFDNFLTGTHRTTHEEMSRRVSAPHARVTSDTDANADAEASADDDAHDDNEDGARRHGTTRPR